MTYDPGSPGDPGKPQPGSGWQGGPPPGYPGGYGQQQPPPGWAQGGPGGRPGPGGPGMGGPGMGGPGPGGSPQDQAGSFFSALFDFGFNRFATPSVVKVLYVLGLVLLALAYLFVLVTGFLAGAGIGILALIGGAIAFLFYLTLFRITLEFYYAVVRMSEDIHNRR